MQQNLSRYAANGLLIDNLTYSYLNGGNQISYVLDARGDIPNVVDYPGNNSTSIEPYQIISESPRLILKTVINQDQNINSSQYCP